MKEKYPILITWFKGLARIILYFLLARIAGGIGRWVHYDLHVPIELANMVILLCQAIVIVIIYLAFKQEFKTDIDNFKKNRAGVFKPCVKYVLMTYLLVGIANTIVIGLTGVELADNEAQVRAMTVDFPLYSVLAIVFIAPVLEELIFRFSLRKLFFDSKWLYVICSGLIFGLLHVISTGDYVRLIPYCLPGWIFAYAYVKEKNIIVPIILHAINNGLGTALLAWIAFFRSLT
jgi:membrane protease YdiL (CAAX protease family)